MLTLLLSLLYYNDYASARLEHNHIQQLAYTFDANDVTVFIHIDNETIQIDTNKDAHHCLKRLPNAVNHCDQILKIKFRHNFDADYEDEDVEQFNQTRKINDTYTKIEIFTLPAYEIECCIHWVLYDCLDYTFQKKCSPKAYKILSEVNRVALLNNLNCTDEYHNSDKCEPIDDPMANKAMIYRMVDTIGNKNGSDANNNCLITFYSLILISIIVSKLISSEYLN